jgi:NADPH:quinone reductase-like Zn-dependent oxidoreductase
VPVVAVTARQMLFRDAGMRPGDRVLVQGAAGNVGAYAVQFARAAGAHVIASVLPRDRDEALRLGADEVISIPAEEAQGLQGTLDTAIDTVGGKAQRDLFAYVRKGGALISSVSVPVRSSPNNAGSRPSSFWWMSTPRTSRQSRISSTRSSSSCASGGAPARRRSTGPRDAGGSAAAAGRQSRAQRTRRLMTSRSRA